MPRMSTMQLAILCILTAAAPVCARSDWRAPNGAASVQALAAAKAAAVEGPRVGIPVVGTRQDKPADVAGAWALTVETAQGTGTPSVIFKQDGEKLTGTYSSPIFGEQQVTGTIKGNAITFSFTGTVEGTAIAVTYSGTVEKDAMKGKVTLGDLGEGTFTGKKK
jgi:hypothetical protein